MIKVSVIVPAYNAEKYIAACLDSLVNQTLDDIEIIVVNDGSTDNTQIIIDDFVSKYPNIIKSYVKENSGVSDTRNYGVSKASGEYIGFVDSDDTVMSTMFEKLYNKASNGDFDITICDVNLVSEKKSKILSSINNDINNLEGIKRQMIKFYPVLWDKIYKKSLFSKVQFKSGVWYEDVELLYRLFPYINSIGVVNEPLINYIDRKGSITNTFNKKLYDYINNWNGIIEFYKKNNFYDEYFDELEYCYCRYLLATFVKGATNFSKKEFNVAVKIAKSEVGKNFPNYRKNKYLNSLKGKYIKYFNSLFANLIYLKYHKNS